MLQSINPSTGATVYEVSASSELQVHDAMMLAKSTFREWSRTPLEQRESIVRRFAEYVAANAESLTQLIMREIGKLRADAAAEVASVVAKVEITIEMMRGRRGDMALESPHLVSQVRYRPLGAVLVLGPYNFPAHLPGGHIVPALLAGNCVVFKPSELAPAVGAWIAEAWLAAGLPKGALNLIQGGREVAKLAIDEPQLAAVFFTGSYLAGKSIHEQLAGRPEVLLALEMGGNNPLVVASPFHEPDAVQTIATSAFVSAGQRCSCARRLIVVEDSHSDAMLESLVTNVRAMRCGLPDDPKPADLGPVVSAAAAKKLLETQAAWLNAGGVAHLMMAQSPRCSALVTPGIIDMTEVTDAGDEEWFGPLLQVYRVASFEEAIQRAAATRFGLAAGLIGGTETMFEEFRSAIPVGIVNWNLPTTGASSRLPFGGLGHSGNHRPAGAFAVDFCNDPIASMLKKS